MTNDERAHALKIIDRQIADAQRYLEAGIRVAVQSIGMAELQLDTIASARARVRALENVRAYIENGGAA